MTRAVTKNVTLYARITNERLVYKPENWYTFQKCFNNLTGLDSARVNDQKSFVLLRCRIYEPNLKQ